MSAPDESELERYSSTSPRDIHFYLRQLAHDGEPLTVRFGEQDSLLTVLLDVDEDSGLLYFDWGGSEASNLKLLHSQRSIFVASPHGVRHQFAIGKAWKVSYENRPAFATRLPSQFIRLQRREFFRISLPLTQRLICRIGARSQGLALPVVDIGVGGLGVEQAALPRDMAAGTQLAGGRIDIPEHHPISSDVELRYTTSVQRGDKTLVRFGFAFRTLSRADETLLQKYLNHVQQELKSRIG